MSTELEGALDLDDARRASLADPVQRRLLIAEALVAVATLAPGRTGIWVRPWRVAEACRWTIGLAALVLKAAREEGALEAGYLAICENEYVPYAVTFPTGQDRRDDLPCPICERGSHFITRDETLAVFCRPKAEAPKGLSLDSLCLAIGVALDAPEPSRALETWLDILETDRLTQKRDVFEALSSFLPVDVEARHDAIADELDRFTHGGSPRFTHLGSSRWSDEPPMTDANVTSLVVAVGICRNNKNEFLVGRRPWRASHFPACWEFPGGKREDGETLEQALVREWREEMGLDVTVGRRQFTGRFALPDGTPYLAVAFDVFPPPTFGGIALRAHDAVLWRSKEALLAFPEPPALSVTPTFLPIARIL